MMRNNRISSASNLSTCRRPLVEHFAETTRDAVVKQVEGMGACVPSDDYWTARDDERLRFEGSVQTRNEIPESIYASAYSVPAELSPHRIKYLLALSMQGTNLMFG